MDHIFRHIALDEGKLSNLFFWLVTKKRDVKSGKLVREQPPLGEPVENAAVSLAHILLFSSPPS